MLSKQKNKQKNKQIVKRKATKTQQSSKYYNWFFAWLVRTAPAYISSEKPSMFSEESEPHGTVLLYKALVRCQAKFLTYYCLSVVSLLLRENK